MMKAISLHDFLARPDMTQEKVGRLLRRTQGGVGFMLRDTQKGVREVQLIVDENDQVIDAVIIKRIPVYPLDGQQAA